MDLITYFLAILSPIFVHSVCPYLSAGTPPSDSASTPELNEYNAELEDLNIPSVFAEIIELLGDSQDCWPADTLGGETSYGGLFIRLAWHCAGTYRDTDGLGGCAGGIFIYSLTLLSNVPCKFVG